MKSQTFTTNLSSKKAFLFLISCFLISGSFAGIIVTPSSTNVNISADKAANATNPEFTLLNDITLTETKATDFAITAGKSKTFILTAPAGWIFNTATGNISVNSFRDFKAVSMRVKEKTITINFIINGTASIDMLTISGVQIKATDGALIPCLGQIFVSAKNAGTAKLPGIKMTGNSNGQGATNFGMVSQITGAATALAFTNKPDSSIAGITFDKQPVIITQDQFGNATTNGLQEVQNVKLVLSSGSGSLNGTVMLNIGTRGGNGMVVFSDLKVNTAGTKKLMAKSGSFTFAVTNEFVVTNENTASENSSDDYDPDLVCYSENKSNNNNASPVI